MKKLFILLLIVIAAVAGFFFGKWYTTGQTLVPAKNGPAIPGGTTGTSINVVSLYDEGSTSTPMITMEYPQFPGANSTFNQAISSSTLGLLAEFRQESTDNEQAREANGAPALPMSAYSFNASWQNAQANSRYVSLVERYDYWNGGANEASDLQTFNYDVKAGHIMTLADLFPGVPDYLQRISRTARQQLSDTLDASSNSILQSMINNGTAPTVDNFANFTFTDYQVTIYFPKYAVAPGAAGEQKVTLPRDISSL